MGLNEIYTVQRATVFSFRTEDRLSEVCVRHRVHHLQSYYQSVMLCGYVIWHKLRSGGLLGTRQSNAGFYKRQADPIS
jgi:hypothetical protein